MSVPPPAEGVKRTSTAFTSPHALTYQRSFHGPPPCGGCLVTSVSTTVASSQSLEACVTAADAAKVLASTCSLGSASVAPGVIGTAVISPSLRNTSSERRSVFLQATL